MTKCEVKLRRMTTGELLELNLVVIDKAIAASTHEGFIRLFDVWRLIHRLIRERK